MWAGPSCWVGLVLLIWLRSVSLVQQQMPTTCLALVPPQAGPQHQPQVVVWALGPQLAPLCS